MVRDESGRPGRLTRDCGRRCCRGVPHRAASDCPFALVALPCDGRARAQGEVGVDAVAGGVQRGDGLTGPILERRAVERTYGCLMLHRRLARDCEALPTRSEAVIHLAMTDLMARRLTGENTISWPRPEKTTKQPIQG